MAVEISWEEPDVGVTCDMSQEIWPWFTQKCDIIFCYNTFIVFVSLFICTSVESFQLLKKMLIGRWSKFFSTSCMIYLWILDLSLWTLLWSITFDLSSGVIIPWSFKTSLKWQQLSCLKSLFFCKLMLVKVVVLNSSHHCALEYSILLYILILQILWMTNQKRLSAVPLVEGSGSISCWDSIPFLWCFFCSCFVAEISILLIAIFLSPLWSVKNLSWWYFILLNAITKLCNTLAGSHIKNKFAFIMAYA